MPGLLDLGHDVLSTIAQYLKYYAVILRRVNRRFRDVCDNVYQNYFKGPRADVNFRNGNLLTCWLSGIRVHRLPVRISSTGIYFIDKSIMDFPKVYSSVGLTQCFPNHFYALCTADDNIILPIMGYCDEHSAEVLINYCCKNGGQYVARKLYDKFCDSHEKLTHPLIEFIIYVNNIYGIFSPRHMQKYCDDDDIISALSDVTINIDSEIIAALLNNPKYKLSAKVLSTIIGFARRRDDLIVYMPLLLRHLAVSARLLTIAVSLSDDKCHDYIHKELCKDVYKYSCK